MHRDEHETVAIREDYYGILAGKGDIRLWLILQTYFRIGKYDARCQTCLTYFWREELDSSPSENPPEMVLIVVLTPCFSILLDKVMELVGD